MAAEAGVLDSALHIISYLYVKLYYILSMAIPINVEDLLNKRKIESSRRSGDYLRDLQLSEGRATGIPTIQDELRKNGLEPARIETDEGRTYFLIEIPCREGFENEMDAKNGTINGMINGTINGMINGTINEREAALIAEIAKQPGIKKNELAEKMDFSVRIISRILQNLSSDALGLIEYSGSKKTGGYVLTEKGLAYLNMLK